MSSKVVGITGHRVTQTHAGALASVAGDSNVEGTGAMIERLTKVLRPERAGEEEAIEAVAVVFNADLLVAMVERAAHREYVAGVEAGTKRLIQNVIDELGKARAHDMA